MKAKEQCPHREIIDKGNILERLEKQLLQVVAEAVAHAEEKETEGLYQFETLIKRDLALLFLFLRGEISSIEMLE